MPIPIQYPAIPLNGKAFINCYLPICRLNILCIVLMLCSHMCLISKNVYNWIYLKLQSTHNTQHIKRTVTERFVNQARPHSALHTEAHSNDRTKKPWIIIRPICCMKRFCEQPTPEPTVQPNRCERVKIDYRIFWMAQSKSECTKVHRVRTVHTNKMWCCRGKR